MSKLRYDLQLTHKVRLTEEEDRKTKDIKATQLAQNKVRNGSRVKDKRSKKKYARKIQPTICKPNCCSNKATRYTESKHRPGFPNCTTEKRENGGKRNEHHRLVRMTTRWPMNEGGKTWLAGDIFVRDT